MLRPTLSVLSKERNTAHSLEFALRVAPAFLSPRFVDSDFVDSDFVDSDRCKKYAYKIRVLNLYFK